MQVIKLLILLHIDSDVFSFFVAHKGKKSTKLMKIIIIEETKIHVL